MWGVTALGLAPCPQRIGEQLSWDRSSWGPHALLGQGACPVGSGCLWGWDFTSRHREIFACVTSAATSACSWTCTLAAAALDAVPTLPFVGKHGSFPCLYSFGSHSCCINQVWSEKCFGRLCLQVGYSPSTCCNYFFLAQKICWH